MLGRADLASLRTSTAVEAPAPVAATTRVRDELYQRLANLPTGKQVAAEVLALFDDGSQLVKIADATARMALPDGARVGDKLSMILVSREPRPTFLLVPPEESAPSMLSTAGRLIDRLLQSAPQETAPPIQPKTPVLPASSLAEPLPSSLVAAAMQESVEYSGMFYESHLRQWLDGSRSAKELAREPQSQLPSSSRPLADAEAPTSAQLARLAARLNDPGDGAAMLARLVDQTNAQQARTTATDVTVIAAVPEALPDIAPDAASLIQQQLNTLEQQRIQWRGELIPGQPMEWEIARDAPEKDAPEAQEGAWTSNLRLALPSLGGISATIRLVGDKVQVQIDADDAGTGTLLQASGASLASALAGAGLPLEFLSVKRHGAS
jgi:hypothetical protein